MIDLARAFVLVAEEVRSGSFEPHVEAFGLKSGVVRYVSTPALDRIVPAAVKARMQAAAESIKAGTLVAAPRPTVMEATAPSAKAFSAPALGI